MNGWSLWVPSLNHCRADKVWTKIIYETAVSSETRGSESTSVEVFLKVDESISTPDDPLKETLPYTLEQEQKNPSAKQGNVLPACNSNYNTSNPEMGNEDQA
ncbi:hypothetical protein TNCT_641361 [Trichonephila clavata]|uniref:Uncharacterized protein n=1 Tax=Trichonephila clavata TaxID=2740835 RepID=A0A8X6LRJ5_TRICU|nr:hypothetical protein TNCT_641361 [Trichonephila clavata]